MRKSWTDDMSSKEDGDESEYHTDQDESSSDESGDKPSDHEEVRDDSDEGIVEEESANTNVNKSDQSKKKKRRCKARIKKECPVPSCDKNVVHLPRHLLKVHGWPKHQARAALLRFNLRKKYSFSTAESAAAGNRKRKTNADENGQEVQGLPQKESLSNGGVFCSGQKATCTFAKCSWFQSRVIKVQDLVK